MNEQQFKQLSATISQVGVYLMNLEDISLFNDTPLHRNIVTLLSQMALKLEYSMRAKTLLIESASAPPITSTNNERYITKRQVVDMCHPLITEYGINQAIKKNDIAFIKRGNKYFFIEEEVKQWIDKKRSYCNDSVRTSNKFV